MNEDLKIEKNEIWLGGFERRTFEELAEPMIDAENASASILGTHAWLEALPSVEALASLHPVDDVRSMPFRNVAFLRIIGSDGRLYRGTAFIVGRHVLATAAHNIFFHDPGAQGKVQHVTVYPGRDGTTAIARLQAIAFQSSAPWIGGDGIADYGAIRVSEDLSALTGFQMHDLPAGNPPIVVTGHPRFDPEHQWSGVANLDQREPRRFSYPIATAPGQSGGPAWLPGTRTAVGIHSRLDGVAIATRLTPAIQADLLSLV